VGSGSNPRNAAPKKTPPPNPQRCATKVHQVGKVQSEKEGTDGRKWVLLARLTKNVGGKRENEKKTRI